MTGPFAVHQEGATAPISGPFGQRLESQVPEELAAASPYDSTVGYTLEYTTGPVWTHTYPVSVLFQVFNRGRSDQHFRARLWGVAGLSVPYNPTDLLYDGDDQTVASHDMGLAYPPRHFEFHPAGFLMFAATIFTTSVDLAPSVMFWDPFVGQRVNPYRDGTEIKLSAVHDINVPFAYYAPGDFSVFTLRPRPGGEVPPIEEPLPVARP